MSNTMNNVALSLMNRVTEIATEYMSERPTRQDIKARDLDRRNKRQAKGRIHAYATSD